mmetsp:Transcript_13842/g.21094  ORF Transcript_13842/g.21094 Transcript_13842/m.21094 type:complete len:331 (-) Transcript_13842:235-1227(-)
MNRANIMQEILFTLLLIQQGTAFSAINLDGTNNNPYQKPFQRPHTVIHHDNSIPSPSIEEDGMFHPKWWEQAGSHENSVKTNEGFMKTYTDRSKEISQAGGHQPSGSSAWWDNPGRHEHTNHAVGMFQTETDLLKTRTDQAKEIAQQEALLMQQHQQYLRQQYHGAAEYYDQRQDNSHISQQRGIQDDQHYDNTPNILQTQNTARYESSMAPHQSERQPSTGPWSPADNAHETTTQDRLREQTERSTGQQWWDNAGNYNPSMTTNEGNFQTQTEIDKERSREQDINNNVSQQQQGHPSDNWWDKPGSHEDSFGFQTYTDRKKSFSRRFSP